MSVIAVVSALVTLLTNTSSFLVKKKPPVGRDGFFRVKAHSYLSRGLAFIVRSGRTTTSGAGLAGLFCARPQPKIVLFVP